MIFDKIIEAFLKMIPFSKEFETWGFSKELSNGIAAVILAIITYIVTRILKRLQISRTNKKAASALAPFFSYLDVQKAKQYYIQSRGQNISPTYNEEPKDSNKFNVSIKLIPWFINSGFNEKVDDNKYYLILAGSGMGKTTFMINLYIKYQSKYNKKYKIVLIPFGVKDVISRIKKMLEIPKDVRETILLLDAFDEFNELRPPDKPDGLTNDQRFRKQFDRITELTSDFQEVIITSRTQYFPDQEDKPYELKVKRYYGDGFHTLRKLYISPFNDNEIKKFLNKKYGVLKFWNITKKKKAKKIIHSSTKLMVRPMLLNYLNYLVDSNEDFYTTYQLYNILTKKWLDREADKRESNTIRRELFKNDLTVLSQKVAVRIYEDGGHKSKSYVKKHIALELSIEEKLNLTDYQITGQSLLVRDIDNNWKFAHKSILEFFLAKHAIEDIRFAIKLFKTNFTGIEMTRDFFNQASDLSLVLGGEHSRFHDPIIKVNSFMIGKNLVTIKKWEDLMGNSHTNMRNDIIPINNISWFDAANYCNKLSKKHNLSNYYKFSEMNSKNLNIYSVTRNENSIGYRLPTLDEWGYTAENTNKSRKFYYYKVSKSTEIRKAFANPGKRQPLGNMGIPNKSDKYGLISNLFEWYDKPNAFVTYNIDAEGVLIKGVSEGHKNPFHTDQIGFRVVLNLSLFF